MLQRIFDMFQGYAPSSENLPSHVAVAGSLGELARIHKKGINLVLFPKGARRRNCGISKGYKQAHLSGFENKQNRPRI